MLASEKKSHQFGGFSGLDIRITERKGSNTYMWKEGCSC